MSQTVKKILGEYSVQTTAADGTTTAGNISLTTLNVNINGNLIVTGTTTSINTENSVITDRIITLNQGEVGAGVSGDGYSGIEVDRGSLADAVLRWNESTDQWEITSDGITYNAIATFGSVLTVVVEDTSPQLGGDLDVNGFQIISATPDQDIVVAPDGAGTLVVNAPIKLAEEPTDLSSETGYTKIYAKEPTGTGGGTGIYFSNDAGTDELVSKRKAKKFGLIF
jgi:hypothetical protein